MRYEGDTIDKLEEITNNQLEIEKKEKRKSSSFNGIRIKKNE